jgi:hypothetical protein
MVDPEFMTVLRPALWTVAGLDKDYGNQDATSRPLPTIRRRRGGRA